MPSAQTIAPVVGALPGARVEVAPGRTFAPVSPEYVPTLAIAELVPAGDGTFRMMARICPRQFSCSAKNLRRLGIDISAQTMRRLINAGFVRGGKTTPNLYLFDYYSYLEHEKAASDPEFWDQTQPGQKFTNLERFRQAL